MGEKTTKDKNTKEKKKQSFFKGLKKEFKKITWPGKTDIAKETTAVIIVSIVTGVIITILDNIVQYGVNLLTKL